VAAFDAAELYARGAATLLASWEAIARGAPGAAVLRLPGVAAAVFPHGPERGVYNNALLERGLAPGERAAAVEAMAGAYAAAGVDDYAAWVHESDPGLGDELAARGFTLAETTRAMGMSLDELAVPRPDVELAPADWSAYVAYLHGVGVPEGLLAGVDPAAFHLLLARRDGETVATALAHHHAGDCGVFNVSTVATARRQGLGTALTARLVHDAVARGCSTASLQSTPMAERLYAAVGFRDLGRILEHAPPPSGSRRA